MTTRSDSVGMRPLGLLASVPYFILPAALMIATLYLLEPVLVAGGMPPYYAGGICLYLPLGLLIPAALLGAVRERARGYSAPLRERFRLAPLRGVDWAWTAGLILAMTVPYKLIEAAMLPWIASGALPLPASIPSVISPLPGAPDWEALTGAPLAGNWLLLAAAAAFLTLNIVGEELWWRGYVYPRQELALGSRAWLVHGLLWMLFHAPKYWAFPALLPGTLAAAFVAWKTGKTTPVLVVHAVTNGIGLVSIAAGVLGLW